MLRRRFILLSIVGTGAATLPLSHCGVIGAESRPELLDAIIGKAGVKDIGKAYVQQFPAEADVKKLKQFVEAGANITSNKRIADDFRKGKTVVVSGWILSVTEARQAALYHLNS